jgi:hypothetical protein
MKFKQIKPYAVEMPQYVSMNDWITLKSGYDTTYLTVPIGEVVVYCNYGTLKIIQMHVDKSIDRTTLYNKLKPFFGEPAENSGGNMGYWRITWNIGKYTVSIVGGGNTKFSSLSLHYKEE